MLPSKEVEGRNYNENEQNLVRKCVLQRDHADKPISDADKEYRHEHEIDSKVLQYHKN